MITLALDGNGIALAIGAGVTGIVSLTNLFMTVANWRKSSRRDTQIKEVKDLVNGKSEQLNALIGEKCFEAGRLHQLNYPDQPSPPVAIITPDSTAIAPQIVPINVPDKK